MNFAEMKAEVFRRLEESSTSPTFWTNADVGLALNEGLEEISDGAEWCEQSYEINLQADAIYYDLSVILPGTFLRLLRGRNLQNNRPVGWDNVRTLDGTYRRWEVSQGEPMRLFVRGLWWLGLFPHVSQAQGKVEIKYIGMPLPLAGDADTPAFPKVYHIGLVEYATYDLLCQEAEVTKALKFWQRYITFESGLRAWVKGRQTRDRVGTFKGD